MELFDDTLDSWMFGHLLKIHVLLLVHMVWFGRHDDAGSSNVSDASRRWCDVVDCLFVCDAQ